MTSVKTGEGSLRQGPGGEGTETGVWWREEDNVTEW